jgi:hypothetical protein
MAEGMLAYVRIGGRRKHALAEIQEIVRTNRVPAARQLVQRLSPPRSKTAT